MLTRRMSMKKKLLLIVLTFSMLLPLFSGISLPVSAAGNVAKIERTGAEYATLEAAVSAAEADDTITLLDNSTFASTLALDKDLTINGAGKTVTYTGSAFAFTVSANVTVKNMTVVAANGGGFDVTSGSLALGVINDADSAVTVNASGNTDSTVALRTSGTNGKITVDLYYANLTGVKGVIRLYSDQYELNIYGGEYNMTCNDINAAADCRMVQTAGITPSAPNRELNIYGGEFYSLYGYVFNLIDPELVTNVYNGYFHHTGDRNRYILIKANVELNIFGGFFYIPNLGIPFGMDTAASRTNAYGGTVICEGIIQGTNYDAMRPICTAGGVPDPKIYGFTSIHKETLSDIDEVTFRPFMRPVLATGAAVSLDPDAPGIKFSATMPQYALDNVNDVKDAGSEVSYGMLIAPLANLDDLPVLNFDVVNCLGLVEGEDYTNITVSETGIGAYGDITFEAELTGIDEADYGTDYTANAYVKFKVNGYDVYVFSNYSEANTRNIKDIAARALADHDEHNMGYTAAQIEVLENYADTTYVEDDCFVATVMSINLLATDSSGYEYYPGQNRSNYSFKKRLGYVLEVMRYAEPDVLLFQEWSKANGWGTVVTLEGEDGRYTAPQLPGYEWVSHKGRSGVAYEDYKGADWWECFNPVVYNTDKYEYISSGTRFVSKSGRIHAQPEDLKRNRDYGQTEYDGDLGDFTWVVLREKTTGLKVIFASTHTYQGSIRNSLGNARNAYMLENMQAMTKHLQTVSQENDNAPVIIGGDFNMPTYGGDLMPHYNQFTEVANYKDAKMTGSDSGTCRNLGMDTRPYWGSTDNSIRIDYIFANGADTYGYEVLTGQVLSDGTYDPYAEVGSLTMPSEGYDVSDHLPIMSNIVVRKGQTYEPYEIETDHYFNPNTKNDEIVENADGTGSTSTKVLLNNEAARAAVKTLTNQNGAQYMKADIVNDSEKGKVLRISATDETNLVDIALNYSDLYTQSLEGYTKIRVTYKTEFKYTDAKLSLRASRGSSLRGYVGATDVTGANNGEWQTVDISITACSDNLKKIGFFGNYMETGLLKGDSIYIASIELTN